jgi:hypothetical protein
MMMSFDAHFLSSDSEVEVRIYGHPYSPIWGAKELQEFPIHMIVFADRKTILVKCFFSEDVRDDSSMLFLYVFVYLVLT